VDSVAYQMNINYITQYIFWKTMNTLSQSKQTMSLKDKIKQNTWFLSQFINYDFFWRRVILTCLLVVALSMTCTASNFRPFEFHISKSLPAFKLWASYCCFWTRWQQLRLRNITWCIPRTLAWEMINRDHICIFNTKEKKIHVLYLYTNTKEKIHVLYLYTNFIQFLFTHFIHIFT